MLLRGESHGYGAKHTLLYRGVGRLVCVYVGAAGVCVCLCEVVSGVGGSEHERARDTRERPAGNESERRFANGTSPVRMVYV